MPRRVESPSSINTYKQCPRKYYYQYIKKLPTYPNIHTVRGNIVHETLEKFFELTPEVIDPSGYKRELASYLSNLFEACWRKRKDQLKKVCNNPDKLHMYYSESKMMLGNWLNHLFKRIDRKMKDSEFSIAFKHVAPEATEIEFRSDRHSVRGFIDVIENEDGVVKLVDYKTSKPKDKISPEYKLQLAIYCLLYKEQHGKLPDKVSIWLLKDKELVMDVDEELLKLAEFEIEQIHFSTVPDSIKEYKPNITPLCKWSTGQCDFYDVCLKERHL